VTASGAVDGHTYQGTPMRAEARPIPVANTMSYTRDDRLFVRRPATRTGYLTFLAEFSSTQRHEVGSTDLNVCILPDFICQTLCLECDVKESRAPPALRIPPHEDARHV